MKAEFKPWRTWLNKKTAEFWATGTSCHPSLTAVLALLHSGGSFDKIALLLMLPANWLFSVEKEGLIWLVKRWKPIPQWAMFITCNHICWPRWGVPSHSLRPKTSSIIISLPFARLYPLLPYLVTWWLSLLVAQDLGVWEFCQTSLFLISTNNGWWGEGIKRSDAVGRGTTLEALVLTDEGKETSAPWNRAMLRVLPGDRM